MVAIRSNPSHIVIPYRFRGPPRSANGGYACGTLGSRLEGAARVTLRRPPPLDVPLLLKSPGPGRFELLNGADLVADAVAEHLEPQHAEPVTFDVATAASAHYQWATGHPFPGCFVCGPEREPGDGLRIFPGPVPTREVVAAPWVPDGSVCDERGDVFLEVVWAALDCPSWFGILAFEPGVHAALLGQLAVAVVRRPRLEERCIAIGWSRGRSDRKLLGAAALFSDDGSVLGTSEAVWIAPRT